MKQLSYTFKKINFLYHIHDTYTAGVMLEGWEVASIKSHGCDINVSFCSFVNNDFCLNNAKIQPKQNHITQNSSVTDKETRSRKLLLNKQELKRIKSQLNVKGYTCVPVRLYMNDKNLLKIEIAIVTGKKLYDKRDDIKKRDLDRDSKRES